jgi:hypothetical protein
MEAPKAKARAPASERNERTGSSTNLHESSESASANTTHTSPSASERSRPAADAVMTSTGQCHRYAEYEREPSHCAGAALSTASTDHAAEVPPRSTRSVATTGTSAHGPGNLVPSSKTKALATMTARPAHENAASARRACRPRDTGSTASNAPAASSKALAWGR